MWDSVASLDAPEGTGYLLLAAEVDGHAGAPSEAKRHLLADLRGRARGLRRELFAQVMVMTAVRLRPVDQAPHYDVVVVLQAPTIECAQWLRCDPTFEDLHHLVRRAARSTHVVVAHNVRSEVCEYGPRLPRAYMLMCFQAADQREVVPGWGWTQRRRLLADLLFSRKLHRHVAHPGSQPILYALDRTPSTMDQQRSSADVHPTAVG